MTQDSFGHGFWLAAATLWWRELIRFYRYPSRVVGALGTPLVFWLLIGSGIGRSFRHDTGAAEMDYLEYFFPGTIVLVLLFTSIFCMMSVIEDRREGFLRSVLVAPVSRASLVLGKVVGGATLAVLQGLLFVLLAPTVGIRLGWVQVVAVTGVLFLIAFALTGLGFVVAWRLDSTQGFHGVVNLFLIPLWLLSGALFPAAGASTWVQWTMRVNPLSYAVALLRQALYPGEGMAGDTASVAVGLAVTLAFAALTAVAAFWVAERPLVRGLG